VDTIGGGRYVKDLLREKIRNFGQFVKPLAVAEKTFIL
jgi:hypothetical protein